MPIPFIIQTHLYIEEYISTGIQYCLNKGQYFEKVSDRSDSKGRESDKIQKVVTLLCGQKDNSIQINRSYSCQTCFLLECDRLEGKFK